MYCNKFNSYIRALIYIFSPFPFFPFLLSLFLLPGLPSFFLGDAASRLDPLREEERDSEDLRFVEIAESRMSTSWIASLDDISTDMSRGGGGGAEGDEGDRRGREELFFQLSKELGFFRDVFR